MGLCGYFCESVNEIKARKFVPQHLAPWVTCVQFLLSHMCEFEILVAVVNSGLLQLPLRSALSHVQHLVGLQLLPRFLTLNAGLFPMSCHLYPSCLPVKGWPWLFLLLFFCFDQKTKWETQREHIFFFPFVFSAKGERVTPVSAKVERVTEIFGQTEREIGPFLILFHCLQPRVRERERAVARV